ncbi:MAG: T9SS type A sorting domain-containing protein [Bacteroidetes bacterium]|nr:T9SS type A sorting domain-containing protein [Bacteroidota bacterium]
MRAFLKLIFTFFVCHFAMAQPATVWSPTGPINFPINTSGQINGIGRTTQIKFDPINVNRIYVTTASGGVWRSNDTGATWAHLGTDVLAKMSCASICIDNTNPNILYLGSGDPNYYSTDYGVWKSTNGGTNWSISNTGMGNRLVVELIMDPANNQNLIAATENGIYKSTSAGTNWTLVKTGGDFKAMVLKPNSLDTVYAVTSSEFWRSLDFGNTWTQITAGVFVPASNGQGMRLAVSKASPNIVYLSMIANEGLTLKSSNFGTSFTTVYNNSAQSLVGYDAITPGQGDYNFSMTADQTNANTVYIAAHCVWKSTNGGVAWTKLTNWYDNCHTDMHGIKQHPVYANMLFDINDGGVFLSRNGGVNWEPRSNGLGATEIYHAAQSKLQRNTVSIGTQDNGELFLNSSTWFTNRGGDWGSKMLFSYNGANTVYYYENGNRRPVNGSETSYSLPFAASNNIGLEFNKKVPNVGFCALQNIYRSTTLNNPTPAWTLIGSATGSVMALHSSIADSSMLYMLTQNNLLYRCDNVFAASPTFTSYPAPGPSNVAGAVVTIATNSNVILVACGNTIYRSTNKGQTFTNYSTGITGGLNIINIYHDEFSANESVYACTAKKVYYRNSSLASWQNITYNLPTIADMNEVMFFNSGTASAALRVSYYGRGVWELPINTSLPPAPGFIVDKQIICPNTTVTFTDQSYGNPTSWQWTFAGGNPSTSTVTNPSVTYPTPGVYPVSLSVTNANGTSVLTQTAYITVINSLVLPISQSFVGVFPPNSWTLFDDAQDQVVWQKSNTVGGYSASSESAFFDNYNFAELGKRDAFTTQNYNLIAVTNPKLYFDVAYARYDNTNYDSLAVGVSTNCGQSYNIVYTKGSTTLATAPDNTGFFTPTATQWRTDTVYLGAYIGQPEVMITFQNRGNYGNVIYVDNINLNASVITTGITKTSTETSLFDVYPNPANEKLNLVFNLKEENVLSLIIRDELGRTVFETNKVTPLIDVSAFTKGIYFISATSNKKTFTKKVIIQ